MSIEYGCYTTQSKIDSKIVMVIYRLFLVPIHWDKFIYQTYLVGDTNVFLIKARYDMVVWSTMTYEKVTQNVH